MLLFTIQRRLGLISLFRIVGQPDLPAEPTDICRRFLLSERVLHDNLDID
jgi:hypothetical protein